MVMPVVYAEWFDRVKGKQLLYQARFCMHGRHDQSENRSNGPMGIASLFPGCVRMRLNNCVYLPATGAEKVIVSYHIHRTWEGYFSPALYNLSSWLAWLVLLGSSDKA